MKTASRCSRPPISKSSLRPRLQDQRDKKRELTAMCKGIVIVAFNVFLTLSAVSVAAQEKQVTWSLKADLPTMPLKPGDQFKVHLTAQIEEGWYLYSLS